MRCAGLAGWCALAATNAALALGSAWTLCVVHAIIAVSRVARPVVLAGRGL